MDDRPSQWLLGDSRLAHLIAKQIGVGWWYATALALALCAGLLGLLAPGAYWIGAPLAGVLAVGLMAWRINRRHQERRS
ncbi:hypothetical protein [Sporichthya brevicatena]|uniref:hypothetical protein n=1 Tax=Sporichthya brevicatena TaxID=171442 RepID=UPI0031D7F9AE